MRLLIHPEIILFQLQQSILKRSLEFQKKKKKKNASCKTFLFFILLIKYDKIYFRKNTTEQITFK